MKKNLITILLLLVSSTIWASAPQDTVSITFLGDIMQHATQLRKALKPGCDSTKSDSFDYSTYYKYVQSRFDKADYIVANMEFPIGTTPYTGYPVFSAPESLLEESVRSGIDLFLCANNHLCDKGERGLKNTLAAYDSLGATSTGLYASPDDEEKNNPFIATIKGVRIAFINFTYSTNGFGVPEPYLINQMDTIQVGKAIIRARQRMADVIIALPHWGQEYVLKESAEQRKWRDFLFGKGVNIIVGSHPHVIQPVEIKRENGEIKSVVVYSLGNFISNMSLTNTPLGNMFTLKLVKNSDSSISIANAESEWVWCAKWGRLEKNYTTISIEDFLDKEELFIDKNDFQNMKRTYNNLSKIFNVNGK